MFLSLKVDEIYWFWEIGFSMLDTGELKVFLGDKGKFVDTLQRWSLNTYSNAR